MDLKGAQIRNILELCKEMQSTTPKPLRVNIPYYQRPYKWDNEKVKNLISDFYKNKASQQDSTEYFVGSVVLVTNDGSDSRMDVVDGQQRVTTVFLLNFIRFLLLRAQVENLIYRQRPGNISEAYGELIECYDNLVGGETRTRELEENRKSLLAGIDEVQDLEDSAKETKWDQLLEEYRESVGLPTEKYADTAEYEKKYCDALYSFLLPDDLAIQYSRSSYNKKLKEALAHVLIADFERLNLHTCDYPGMQEGDEGNRYLDAIFVGFNELKREAEQSCPEDDKLAEKIIHMIGEMVEQLRFCAVVTGNEKDAFTLFEVLNDRAMEVDDLDLIKNLLFKIYCNHTHDDDEVIDQVIGEEDARWGEEIFTPENATKAKRISYFATVFLTGNTTIRNDRIEKYRENIEKEYLNQILETKGEYTHQQLKRDIDVFEMVEILLNEFGIVEARHIESAIKAQNNPKLSITVKAMRLFRGLNQDGIAAALVNIILKTFRNYYPKTDGEIAAFSQYIDDLKAVENEGDTEKGYKEINDWARRLWKASLMAKDYKIPREIARSVIENVSENSDGLASLSVSSGHAQKLVEQFDDWTSSYSYGSNATNLCVKVLFHELMGKGWSNGKLNDETSLGFSFNSDALNLDHLEPDARSDTFQSLYYEPESKSLTRQKVVNGLGNMMLIDFLANVKMGNKPIDKRLNTDYREKLPDTWLVDETKRLLEENSKEVDVNGDTIRIPTDDFFAERQKFLQDLFLQAIGTDF